MASPAAHAVAAIVDAHSPDTGMPAPDAGAVGGETAITSSESDKKRTPHMSEETLIADLLATFPGIHARPLREFGAKGWTHGVWTGGEARMPDGLPVFSDIAYADDTYDGGVHTGFSAWLEARGWYLERYDELAFFIVTIASAEAP